VPMLIDYRFEPLCPTAARRWILVYGMAGDILRSRELPPYDDPRTALDSIAEELRREGWDSICPEQQPYFAARRGNDSLNVSLSIVSPDLLHRTSFLST